MLFGTCNRRQHCFTKRTHVGDNHCFYVNPIILGMPVGLNVPFMHHELLVCGTLVLTHMSIPQKLLAMKHLLLVVHFDMFVDFYSI